MLAHRILKTILRHGMIEPYEKVLVALSGGPDSVALTHLLIEVRQLPSSPPFELLLAHLNHELRPDAAEDEAFCQRLALRLGLPFVSGRADVAGRAQRERDSLEVTARRARYDFLEKAARQWSCSRIALGHTLNDQAETFLLRLTRGSGITGLSAMRPVSDGQRIRPLLEIGRDQVLEYLTSRGLEYRVDPTNADCSILRNRIRHRALPFLAQELNPAILTTLARSAGIIRDEEDWMEQEAQRAWDQGVHRRSSSSGVELAASKLADLHPALARRIIRRAILETRGDLRCLSARHVEDALGLVGPAKSGRRLHLPGLDVARSFNTVVIRRASGFRRTSRSIVGPEFQPGHGYNEYEYVLPIPGRVKVPEAGGAIEAVDSMAATLPAAAGCSVVVGLPAPGDDDTGLRVRSPRRGDRFRPLGAPGTKSLSRYLMEHRVERHLRRLIPLVVRGEKDVLWVVGHGVSELSRIGPGTGRALHLTWVEG